MSGRFASPLWYRVADLAPELKRHVTVNAHRYRGRLWYVLSDEVTGRVHRLTPQAYSVVAALDGTRTLDGIFEDVARRYGAEAPSQQDVIQLLGQLHQMDLLRTDDAPAVRELVERLDRQRKSERKKRFGNPLSLTVPLIDPDRMLAAIDRVLRPVPGWAFALLWAAAVIPAAFGALLHADELSGDLGSSILSAVNLALLAVVFPFTKLVHELGHGLAIKRFGGTVREAGVMLLVFYPMPYVDATSTIAFPSKWKRIFVGAAGMVAELFLAALAFAVWVSVEPGLVRAMAYDVMLIASVSTLVVNGNPLLRFDAYHMLADLLEMPNLGNRANRAWGHLVQTKLFRVPDKDYAAPGPGERPWLLAYAPAAFVYRLVILFSIAIFVAGEYLLVGVLIAVWSLWSGLVKPAGKTVGQLFRNPSFERHRGRSIGLAAAAAVVAIAILAAVPMPMWRVMEGVVWLPDDAELRVGQSGFLARVEAEPGSMVAPGDLVATLVDPQLETDVEVARQDVRGIRAELAAARFADRSAAKIASDRLAAAEERLADAERRLARLQIRSLAAGRLVLPGAADAEGRFLREGETIGYVVPAAAPNVRVVVPQTEVDLVRSRVTGIEARIADRAATSFAGRIMREVPSARNELPSPVLATTGGGSFALDPAGGAELRTLEGLFQFDVALDPVPADASFGTRVHVKFSMTPEPLAAQGWRRLRQLFLSVFHA